MNKIDKNLLVETPELIRGDALDVLRRLPKNYFSLLLTSPPYNIGKEYELERKWSLKDYISFVEEIISEIIPKIKKRGSICWQVGNYIKDGELFPLDIYTYHIFKSQGMKLRNRIIWRFNFGLHAQQRFSGRYETILWFTKSDDYRFNLDPVRVPQLYPGKRHSTAKGKRAGKPSGNPLGKNPSDFWEFSAAEAFEENPVWEMPNVKANHPEKTVHPCQFPMELAERCILALTKRGERVLDPFVGTGTSVIAATKLGRIGCGIDQSEKYIRLARERLRQLEDGTLKARPSGKPIHVPRCNDAVAKPPPEWA